MKEEQMMKGITLRYRICDILAVQPEATDEEICIKLKLIIKLKKQYAKELLKIKRERRTK